MSKSDCHRPEIGQDGNESCILSLMARKRLGRLQTWILLRIRYAVDDYITRRWIYIEYWGLKIPDEKEVPASRYKPIDGSKRVILSRVVSNLERKGYIFSKDRGPSYHTWDDVVRLTIKGREVAAKLDRELREVD
jgi:hypothetical protein